ncbi:MAG TPA: universal stress protein [Solirubrobacterales bacterium]|nr:universal stress protein [Solirubrobacterales bacterium]
MPGKVMVGYLDGERGRDALALGRILARARDAELAVTTVPEGPALADAARAEDADLVVLGSTHRGPLGRIVPGTTMEHVLTGASCAVAVAPPGFAERADGEPVWQPLVGDEEDVGMRVVGVGYDGGPAAREALELATDLAIRNGAALRVYTVVPKGAPGVPDAPSTAAPTAPGELELRRAELHETVAALPPEVRAQPVLLRGFAETELVRAAGLGVDLLVVGTRARGHLGRLFHKSAAGELALEAPCPLLICPARVGARLVGASQGS